MACTLSLADLLSAESSVVAPGDKGRNMPVPSTSAHSCGSASDGESSADDSTATPTTGIFADTDSEDDGSWISSSHASTPAAGTAAPGVWVPMAGSSPRGWRVLKGSQRVFVTDCPIVPDPPKKPVMSDTEALRTHATTVLIRNIPKDRQRGALELLLDRFDFCGRYDFVHVPVDLKDKDGSSLGWAIVNFVTHADALDAKRKLERFFALPEKDLSSALLDKDFHPRPFHVCWGEKQGLMANVEHYRDGPMNHPALPDHFRPAVFHAGVRVAFPAPTKPVRLPRGFARRPTPEA